MKIRTERVHLSLGSNVGDRLGYLRRAIALLQALDGVHVMQTSHLYETEPVGYVDQPAFVNMAVEIETTFEPLELLEAVKGVECRLGRTLTARWGPREIDIDIILWGPRTVETELLTLPHKEFRNRAFVLAPLAEIAPDAVDPVSGFTAAELAKMPEGRGAVVKLDEVL